MIIKLKNVRLAFPVLFTPREVMGSGKAQYSATLLLDKTDPQIAAIDKCISDVAAAKWATRAAQHLTALRAGDKICLRDGAIKANYEGFEGCMYISATRDGSKGPPSVFDRNPNLPQLTEASGKPYAGCYVNAEVDIWAQDNQFGKRINAMLSGVQFVRDGDAFSGAPPSSPASFENIESDADAVDAFE